VALVKRLMARKLKIRPIATSRIVLPNIEWSSPVRTSSKLYRGSPETRVREITAQTSTPPNSCERRRSAN
jgi:hypothetical protein